MGRLEFGRLTHAWKGEASDFTPLLAERLDQLGDVIGVDLTNVGRTEVPTTGGRRIDIVASADGAEIVIENQYGKADHDHLTRGLAYAVARHARGLVVVAEEHRDEFRAVAQYLNDVAETSDQGISVWLVEARAVRIGDSAWAPLFTAIVEPNSFTASVEQAKQAVGTPSPDEFWAQFADDITLSAVRALISRWRGDGLKYRFNPDNIVLMAPAPAVSGLRSVVAVYVDGRVLVPFNSYTGANSGIPIASLGTEAFRRDADALFGFHGGEKQARTVAGWLTPSTVERLYSFCRQVAAAYREAVDATSAPDVDGVITAR